VLLKHFGSVAQLKKATPEQITEVHGIGPALARTIHERLTSR
jgi:excinuclease ABC subunit C